MYLKCPNIYGMSVLIWIQTVWSWVVVFIKRLNFEESQQTEIKHEQFPSMQIDKYRTFAKECVII